MKLTISDHAVDRYRERVAPDLPSDAARARIEMFGRLMSAKPKHLKRLGKASTKRTTVIPTEGCIFITSFGTIVTVLDKMRGAST
jgi:hypothetical protein